MYDVGGKLLSGINSTYADSSAYVRIKGDLSEQFRIDSGVRQGCIMSPWLFNVYMDAVMKELKMGLYICYVILSCSLTSNVDPIA